MIFLNTSSVPPAIRIAVENNNPFWNTLFNTGFFSSRTYPPISIKSNAYDDTSCILDAVTSLLIDNSGPGVWPFDKAVILLYLVYFKPLDCTYQSAIFCLTSLLFIARPSSTSKSRVISNISSKSKPAGSPTASLSFIKVVRDTFQPSPSLPSLCESGMRTSLKKTSLKLEEPDICSIGLTSIPGVFISKKKYVNPLCFTALGSERATIIP